MVCLPTPRSASAVSLSRSTYGAELPIIQRLREKPIVQKREGIPLMRTLSLKIPENPSLSLAFKGIELRFDVSADVVFCYIIPVGDVVFACAGADESGAWISAVVAGANVVAVEGTGATGRRD